MTLSLLFVVVSPSQQVWKSLKFQWKFVWALNLGPLKLVWWQMPSSWNAKSLKHITRRTLSGCTEENDSLSAPACYRELRANRKILEMHVSNCEANSIPHIKPKLFFLVTSPFLTDRMSKMLRQQTCVCLFFLPLCNWLHHLGLPLSAWGLFWIILRNRDFKFLNTIYMFCIMFSL